MSGGPPKPPREGYNIFNGKRVMLGLDLMINDRLREVIVDIITQTKGKVTSDVDEADVYIGQYREGDDYVLASRRSAHVGNLTWLYWMFAHGEWTNPYDRLLHYPIVRGGIPGMKDKVRICQGIAKPSTFTSTDWLWFLGDYRVQLRWRCQDVS